MFQSTSNFRLLEFLQLLMPRKRRKLGTSLKLQASQLLNISSKSGQYMCMVKIWFFEQTMTCGPPFIPQRYIIYTFISDFLSSPEPNAQVSFSDHNLSIVRCCWRCRKHSTFSSSSPEPLGQFQANLHPWVKGIQVCSNDNNVDNGFFSPLNQCYDNYMCLLIWTVFSSEQCGP